MLIRMTETRMGCADGFTVERYHEGKAYDVPDSLASHFVRNQQAVRIDFEHLTPADCREPSVYEHVCAFLHSVKPATKAEAFKIEVMIGMLDPLGFRRPTTNPATFIQTGKAEALHE